MISYTGIETVSHAFVLFVLQLFFFLYFYLFLVLDVIRVFYLNVRPGRELPITVEKHNKVAIYYSFGLATVWTLNVEDKVLSKFPSIYWFLSILHNQPLNDLQNINCFPPFLDSDRIDRWMVDDIEIEFGIFEYQIKIYLLRDTVNGMRENVRMDNKRDWKLYKIIECCKRYIVCVCVCVYQSGFVFISSSYYYFSLFNIEHISRFWL